MIKNRIQSVENSSMRVVSTIRLPTHAIRLPADSIRLSANAIRKATYRGEILQPSMVDIHNQSLSLKR